MVFQTLQPQERENQFELNPDCPVPSLHYMVGFWHFPEYHYTSPLPWCFITWGVEDVLVLGFQSWSVPRTVWGNLWEITKDAEISNAHAADMMCHSQRLKTPTCSHDHDGMHTLFDPHNPLHLHAQYQGRTHWTWCQIPSQPRLCSESRARMCLLATLMRTGHLGAPKPKPKAKPKAANNKPPKAKNTSSRSQGSFLNSIWGFHLLVLKWNQQPISHGAPWLLLRLCSRQRIAYWKQKASCLQEIS